MAKETKILSKHPRAESLKIREKLIKHHGIGVVAQAGLIAHGRGEAFDYLLGERTSKPTLEAMKAAAAALLTAKHPVISVNGNVAALVASSVVELANVIRAKIEVNLFHRSLQREKAIEKVIKDAGATEVLGVGGAASATLREIGSERRRVDPEGILIADVVLIPLEDGDRTEALVHLRKKVIAIDLNPLSRTAQLATITIVDNIVRAMPALVRIARELRKEDKEKLEEITSDFDNKKNLGDVVNFLNQRLSALAKSEKHLSLLEMSKI